MRQCKNKLLFLKLSLFCVCTCTGVMSLRQSCNLCDVNINFPSGEDGVINFPHEHTFWIDLCLLWY